MRSVKPAHSRSRGLFCFENIVSYICSVIRPQLIILILFFPCFAKAQNSVSISPLLSVDFGSPLFINRTTGLLNPFGISPTGSSSDLSYGLGAEISMPGIISGNFGLDGRLLGMYSSGRFTFDAANYSVSGIDRTLEVELGATWSNEHLNARVGPWILQSISSDVYENDPNGNNVTPANAKAASTQLGLVAGVGFQISNFPIRPELNAHLDLTELSTAGVNALSVGISLSYVFGSSPASTKTVPNTLEVKPIPTKPTVATRVHFLVNGSKVHGDPPLERVETHVKQYEMVDSANASPSVTQWVEESFHLPHLSLACEFDRRAPCDLILSNKGVRFIEKHFERDSTNVNTFDTTIDLERDDAWNDVLSHLNTTEDNYLIAVLRFNSGLHSDAIDTLVLPPADTSRVVGTTVKRQARFVLSDHYHNVSGGGASLDLLLGKLRSLLDSNAAVSVSIIESAHDRSSASYNDLRALAYHSLGASGQRASRQESSEPNGTITVILEY